MKLVQIIILVFIAALIAQSDPYGLEELDPDQKKNRVNEVDTVTTNINGKGYSLVFNIHKGAEHNHPLFAIWVEDLEGNYIQTLYVARSVAIGIFNYGDVSNGSWSEGVVRRPAALPYWSHKRGIQAPDGLYMPSPDQPVPDAYSGATPQNDCVLFTRLDNPGPDQFYVYFEINQPWDWNEYWTNNKFPDDEEYKTSSQPALVYRALFSPDVYQEPLRLEPVGHSHYSGKDGSLNEDLSTMTTSLEIISSIEVSIRKQDQE